MALTSRPRVAIIGGGPVGLEAALYARAAGLEFVLYERGEPGEAVGRWGFVKMFTPFGWNSTPLGKQAIRDAELIEDIPADTTFQTGREYRDTYLHPISQLPDIRDRLRTNSTVLRVGRSGLPHDDITHGGNGRAQYRLLIRTTNQKEVIDTADAVLDCSGVYATPNWLGDGGIPAVGELAARQHISYWLEDVKGAKRDHYAGKSVIVVGSGLSAATAVCDLTELADDHPSTWVIWLTRSARSQPVVRVPNDPVRERDRLAVRANTLATRCDGNLEHHACVGIEEVVYRGNDDGCQVVATVDGKRRVWEADRIIVATGYQPDTVLTSALGDQAVGHNALPPESGYYRIGSKGPRRRSAFLIRDAHEQIRRAYAQVVARPQLNLYASAA